LREPIGARGVTKAKNKNKNKIFIFFKFHRQRRVLQLVSYITHIVERIHLLTPTACRKEKKISNKISQSVE